MELGRQRKYDEVGLDEYLMVAGEQAIPFVENIRCRGSDRKEQTFSQFLYSGVRKVDKRSKEGVQRVRLFSIRVVSHDKKYRRRLRWQNTIENEKRAVGEDRNSMIYYRLEDTSAEREVYWYGSFSTC